MLSGCAFQPCPGVTHLGFQPGQGVISFQLGLSLPDGFLCGLPGLCGAHARLSSPGVDDRGKGFLQLIVRDGYVVTKIINEQLGKDRLVQHLAGRGLGFLVELARVVEQFHGRGQHLAAGLQLAGQGVELGCQPCSVVMDVLQPLVELGLGHLTFAVEVEVAVFAGVEFTQFLLDRFAHLAGRGLFGGGGFVHEGGDPGDEVLGQVDGGVVGFDGCDHFGDAQVGQVTAGLVLATPAEVVEVQFTLAVLAAHDDQPLLAAVAPDHTLEVVVVGAFAGPAASFGHEHALYAVEQLLVDERFVLAVVLGVAPFDVAEVVAVLEHGAEAVDRDRAFAVQTVGPGA